MVVVVVVVVGFREYTGLQQSPHCAVTIFVPAEVRNRAAADPQAVGNIDLSKPHDPNRFTSHKHNYVVSILGQLWQDKKDRIKAAAQAARGGSTGHGAKKKTLADLRKEKEKKIEKIQHDLNMKLNKLTRRSDELRVEAKNRSGRSS